MVQAGMEDATSYNHVLSAEYASMIALEFNKNPIVDDEAAFDLFPQAVNLESPTLRVRPPIVTIMGHVDHGKTTLLDTLRSTSVAKGEAGGITQHIGAFSVPVSGNSPGAASTITFLDTPGHAAFSAMRARGANVTDIVVLVVAADDGVMPQTKEVIELVKKDDGKVNVVVAINKMDKPGADPEAIQKELLAEGLQLEIFGGHVPAVNVSGLTGKGLDELVETISLVAEMADLRAERKGDAFGYVLESKVLKGLGPVATVLVLQGELTPAAHLICGTVHARVRQLLDSSGKVLKAAYPGMAVTVSGWKELPNAGDEVLQGKEADVKKAVTNRRRRLDLATIVQDAEAINTQRKRDREKKDEKEEAENTLAGPGSMELKSITDGPKELRLIIKCDVSGSVEAVVGALQDIGNKEAKVKIVQSTVGDVSESDIMLAKAAEGTVVAFAVGVPRAIQTMAAGNDVPILTSSIIYRLMDDVKAKVIGMLPPIIETRVTGEATVAQLFNIQLKRHEFMKIAGCRVTNGLLEKNKKVRVVRNGTVVHESGALQTLRHLKKDMLEIRKEMECGLSIQGYEDIQVGDIIQSIQIVEKPGLL
ncbi:initiation factor 2 [Hysterangium stoloniferum]|nr:initiation factor 2 [Hysterangium stoloniferum]